ncbi:alpha/beta fold hydrolase [Nocardia sp. CDC160]|uniref:alpha/beta fold hydrolase n=1 Tax=Nocardia sp. CDC160 TaxID=3112166 RepID=UPI002DBDABBA|nr:alpha/beta hydrolase [Nocardia sp. CDC160]MEC3918406.1 alpha/beta hydrolase [Nocardia sp. CDC160]MEC3919143.1 alpha/beta hydrolase [Nocardia sp. CDC160]
MTDFVTTSEGTRLAYVDSGGPGRPLLALHGAFGCGRCWMPMAERLGRRIIALDQRGHGESDKPGDYSRAAFVSDAAAVIEKLGLGPVSVIGHSLGAINAYQLAAQRPELVESFVALDFPVEVGEFTDPWLDALPARFPSLTQMRATLHRLVSMGVPFHFMESAVRDSDGWHFQWRAEDMRSVKRGVIGTWWNDWTGSTCPALLLLGGDSAVVPPDHAREMVSRRPNTALATIAGAGHDLYLTHTDEVAAHIARFLP